MNSDYLQKREPIALVEEGAILGFKNESGQALEFNFPQRVVECKPGFEGYVPVKICQNGHYYWLFVDINGKRACQELFLEASIFFQGKALVVDLDNHLRVLNKKFQTLSLRSTIVHSCYYSKLIEEYDRKPELCLKQEQERMR